LADFRRGIEAGVVTGIIYLVVYVVVGVILMYESLYLTRLLDAAGLSPVESPLYPFIFSSLGIVSNVVRGIVFGAVFATLYNFLPGTKNVIKGVVLSLFLWIVTVIEVVYTTPGWAGIRGIFYGGTVVLSSVSLVLVGIISALVFGALTGFLWDRFRGKELAEERKGRSVLLLSFILGVIIWVLFALMFLIGRVPLIVIGSEFWWEQIVTRLVLFLGLPGWVLTLVAWRKTRRGESGFKWGVAGGVLMALTGIMLLPGALAIIGGVFSGRKPTSEPSTVQSSNNGKRICR
jgi:hypothetical protein